MTSPYADFKIYFGSCSSQGIKEGTLSPAQDSKRYSKAMNIVQEELEQYNAMFNSVRLRGYSFVENEPQAKKLIDLAIKNIKGADLLIKLYSCMHGEIDFERILRFKGWRVNKKDELIARLKEIAPSKAHLWKGELPWSPKEPVKLNPLSKFNSEEAVWNYFLQFKI